jgi:hypothetical protein
MSINNFSGWTEEDFARWLRENHPKPTKDRWVKLTFRVHHAPDHCEISMADDYEICINELAGELFEVALPEEQWNIIIKARSAATTNHSPMTRDKLGDSYDIVKRFFRHTLFEIAPLEADPYFLEPRLEHRDYEQVTGIPVRPRTSPRRVGLLLDPHTGIHIAQQLRKGRSYATTQYIATSLQDRSVAYCVVFDQSYSRNGVPREDQLRPKLDEMADHRVGAFYYVSHAPFLFAARDLRTIRRLRRAFEKSGLPGSRFLPREVA